MWKRCEFDGKEYLIKHIINGTLHKLYVTDLVRLWFEEISEDCLLQRCKEMNKLVEASDEVLLTLVWSLVEGEGEDIVTCFADDDSGKRLNLQSNLDGLKFRIKFILCLADHTHFFEEVSCPLLTTISELEKRQSLLIDLMKKKDLEIAEYKLEGAKISRKAVETQVFEPEVFSRKCAEDLGATKGLVLTRPSHTFTPFVQELLGDIATTAVITPRENHDGSKGVSKNSKKSGPIKLKSPVKAKRPKFYDDEEDEISQQEVKKEVESTGIGSLEQNKELEARPTKGNARPKVKKILSNL